MLIPRSSAPSSSVPSPSAFRPGLASLLLLPSLLLAGCGIGAVNNRPSDVTASRIGGAVIGGQNPIIGATVKIYTTGNSDGTNGGYGVATMRQEATAVSNLTGAGDTDNNGFFSFAGGYSCPSGQYAYVVSAGGNTGAAVPTTQATATANLTGGAVSSFTITNQGAGYLAATVTITPAAGDTTGTGATATATVAGGKITAIQVTNGGANYTAAPTVTISAPTSVNGTNPNAVLVAALGRCDDLFTAGVYNANQSIYLNEQTTVAAAYALGHFSAESGSGAATTIQIGAPDSNNATVGSATTTAVSGLGHAFQNAAVIATPFAAGRTNGFSSTNATVPGNTLAVLPQQLVNTIANILVSCVNSGGGVANDGSACGSLFKYTVAGSTNPVDTWQATVNLAANPTLTGSVANVVALFNVANGFTNVYSPFINDSTNLNDFSLAIYYPKSIPGKNCTAGTTTGTCQATTYTVSGAVDLNDIYYLGNSISSGTAPANIFALSSNGVVLGTTTNNTLLKNSISLAVDAIGNGYIATGSGSTTNAIGAFTTNNGNLASLNALPILTANGARARAIAVDRSNNVWTFGDASGGTVTAGLYESAAGGSSFSSKLVLTPTIPTSGFVGLSVDPDQNIWSTASTALNILRNDNGTATAGAYSGAALSGTTTNSPADNITFGPGTPYIPYVSAYNSTVGVQPYAVTLSGANLTAVTAGANSGGSNPVSAGPITTGAYQAEADGLGNLLLADNNSGSVVEFFSGTITAARMKPCLPVTPGASSGCASLTSPSNGIFGASGKPYSLAIDSTGSIWVTAPANGVFIQMIGVAAPTWPLLSSGKTGRP